MGNNDYAPKNHYITRDLIKKEAGKKGVWAWWWSSTLLFYEEKIEEMHHQSSSNGKWEIHWIDNERAHSTFLCFYQEIRTLVESSRYYREAFTITDNATQQHTRVFSHEWTEQFSPLRISLSSIKCIGYIWIHFCAKAFILHPKNKWCTTIKLRLSLVLPERRRGTKKFYCYTAAHEKEQ